MYKDPVDYVNPNIGTIGHLLTATSPTVMLPHGMAQVAPITTPGIMDRYLADKIYGFPVANVGRTSPAAAAIMATNGATEIEPAKYASTFDHDLEIVSPYHYSVLLEDYDIIADCTVTAHAIYYRFTYPGNAQSHIVLNMKDSSELEILDATSLTGYLESSGVRHYIYIEFSKPFQSCRTWHGSTIIML